MADEEHLKILRQGVAAWNEWREKYPDIKPDLSEADLREADLREADLFGADLREAELLEADLHRASLHDANLRGAGLREADLSEANLREADLTRAKLIQANLYKADLGGADLSEADLCWAQLIFTNICDATLTGSKVDSVLVCGIEVNYGTKQQNLIIPEYAGRDQPAITVDNIKVAQFIYLLLNNQEIRDVIDTITSKAVLILGRFSEERKRVLDAIREELRKHDYLPIMLDFQPPPDDHPTLGTIKTLASMARFVIVDLTDARSVLGELVTIVPAFPAVAVRLMIKKSQLENGMLDEIRSYRSVVEDTYEYEDDEEVIASIKENVIGPAEAKVKQLRQRNLAKPTKKKRNADSSRGS